MKLTNGIAAGLIGLAVNGMILASAIVGQTDNFEDGTTMGWFVPGDSSNVPSNQPSGGPGGSGDAYLRLVSQAGLVGAGSHLSALNDSQWAGNYLAAGVSLIRMDVNNFGPSDLYLGLLFEDFAGAGPPVNLALSANAIFVPANSGWLSVQFPVATANLIAVLGTANGALTSTDTLRIFHNFNPEFPGPGAGIPTVTAVLGIDNITVVPEPATLSFLAGGLLALFVRRRFLTIGS